MFQLSGVVDLNVGGALYSTTLLTLTKNKGTMLAAMFGGDYRVTQKDQNGRYFIDADGSLFAHILSYLRSGELPPAPIAEAVYKEAVYFGLHELVEQLERIPSILARIHRESYRSQFSGYHDVVRSVIDVVSTASTKNSQTYSEVYVAVISQCESHQFPNFDINHVCTYNSTKGRIQADVTLRSKTNNEINEKDAMNCIEFDLKEQGFCVTHDRLGQCTYICNRPIEDFPQGLPATEECPRQLYRISFYWWKS
jgi:hypothetical protein